MLELEIRKERHIFESTVIMGILNITPDSFSDGGKFLNCDDALWHCEQMLSDGADIIDVGGCSTRPNSQVVGEEEEIQRVVPVLREIRKRFPRAIVSVDTYRKEVACRSIEEGADIVNDISGGLFDADMLSYVAGNNVPYIMSHICGTPQTMHSYQLNDGICTIVADFFRQQLGRMSEFGSTQVVLDPGIGFSKSLDANYELLNGIGQYRIGNLPVLIGVSRKSLINKVLGTAPDTSENGTTVLNTIAMLNGADIIRCHNIKNAVQARKLVEKCKKNSNFAKK